MEIELAVCELDIVLLEDFDSSTDIIKEWHSEVYDLDYLQSILDDLEPIFGSIKLSR